MLRALFFLMKEFQDDLPPTWDSEWQSKWKVEKYGMYQKQLKELLMKRTSSEIRKCKLYSGLYFVCNEKWYFGPVSQFYLYDKGFLCKTLWSKCARSQLLIYFSGLWRSCTVLNTHLLCFTSLKFYIHISQKGGKRGMEIIYCYRRWD